MDMDMSASRLIKCPLVLAPDLLLLLRREVVLDVERRTNLLRAAANEFRIFTPQTGGCAPLDPRIL